MPLYNDWKSATKLLDNIDLQVGRWDAEVSIIIVNDASTEEKFKLALNFKKIKSLKILNMKQNIGHQRCIAVGLKYICENENFDRVIIMDADGEDRPEELNNFFDIAMTKPDLSITGNRFKRSEGLIFKLMYEVHKVLTLVFTGKLIKFGNFSCLSRNHAKQLIQKSYLWNSYSSSVVRAVDQRTFIPSTRGYRYVLPSKMNFVSLIFHSFSIISVFRKQFIIRSTLFLLVYFFFIFNNISIFSLAPVILLLIFSFVILKISMRANYDQLNKSLDNIINIDTLKDSNGRQ